MNKIYKKDIRSACIMGFGLIFFGVSQAETATSNSLANMVWDQAKEYAIKAFSGNDDNKVDSGANIMGWPAEPEVTVKDAKVKSLGDYLNTTLIKALEAGNVEDAQAVVSVPAQLPDNKKKEKNYIYQMMIPVIIQGIKVAIQNLNWETMKKTVQWFNSMQDHTTSADKIQVKELLRSADQKVQQNSPGAVDMLQDLVKGM